MSEESIICVVKFPQEPNVLHIYRAPYEGVVPVKLWAYNPYVDCEVEIKLNGCSGKRYGVYKYEVKLTEEVA